MWSGCERRLSELLISPQNWVPAKLETAEKFERKIGDKEISQKYQRWSSIGWFFDKCEKKCFLKYVFSYRTPRSDTWYAEFLSIQYFAKSPILLSFFKNVLTDINIFMNVLQGRKYRHLYQYFANSFLSICQGFGYAWVADPSVNNFFFIWFSFLISFWSKTYISTRSTLMPQAVVASSRTIWENIDLKNILKHILKGIFWRELSFSWEIDFLLSRPPRRFNIQTLLNLFFLSWYHVLRLSQLGQT